MAKRAQITLIASHPGIANPANKPGISLPNLTSWECALEEVDEAGVYLLAKEGQRFFPLWCVQELLIYKEEVKEETKKAPSKKGE